MKKAVSFFLEYFLVLLLIIISGGLIKAQVLQAISGDQSTIVTTTANDTWQDVKSVTLTLDGATSVLVVANFEMQVLGGTQDVVGYYRLTDGTNFSPEISRYVVSKSYDDHGLGSLVYIFTYTSPGSTGSKTFTMQHKRTVPGNSKDISSKANMIAVVVDDDNVTLPNSVKSIGDVTTTSTTYEKITGSQTDAINLTNTSKVYVSVAFSTLGSTSLTGSWILRQSTDGSNFSEISDATISRTNSTNVGAATITYMTDDLTAGTYYFDLAHKTNTGTLTTRNLSISTLGLTGADGNVYPAFKSTAGSGTTTSSTPVSATTTSAITSENNSNSLFIHSTFNMLNNSSADPIDAPGFALSASTGTFTPITYERYLLASGAGSGGLVGLVTGLSYNDAPTVSLNHNSNSSVSLTTQNINIVGFQLKSSPREWDGSTNNDWNTAANWTPEGVPTENNNVIISSGTIVIADDGSASCYDLNVSGGTLTINSSSSGTGSLIAMGTINGDITTQRHLTSDEWHIISPPVTGQSINGVLINGSNSIAFNDPNYGVTDYNESSNNWNSFFTSATGGNFTNGKGYLMRRQTSDGVVSFAGTVTNSDVSVPVTLTSTNGWNCVGNPYPSAMGANSSATSTENFLTYNAAILNDSYEALYVWDETAGGGAGDYVIVCNSGFSNGTGKTIWASDYVQSGQGFIVRTTAAGNVTFTPDMRIHSTTQAFKSEEKSWPGIVVKVESNEHSASTGITFYEGMTNALDPGYEAGVFKSNTDLVLYSQLVEDNGVDFGLQSLPLTAIDQCVIPLGIETSKEQEVTFRIDRVEIPDGTIIILEDRLLNIFQPFETSDDSYQTTINPSSSAYGRFYLSTEKSSSVSEYEPISYKVFYSDGNINIIGETDRSANATLYDILGRRLFDSKLTDKSVNRINVTDIRSGVYMLSITSGGNSKSYKLIVNN